MYIWFFYYHTMFLSVYLIWDNFSCFFYLNLNLKLNAQIFTNGHIDHLYIFFSLIVLMPLSIVIYIRWENKFRRWKIVKEDKSRGIPNPMIPILIWLKSRSWFDLQFLFPAAEVQTKIRTTIRATLLKHWIRIRFFFNPTKIPISET